MLYSNHLKSKIRKFSHRYLSASDRPCHIKHCAGKDTCRLDIRRWIFGLLVTLGLLSIPTILHFYDYGQVSIGRRDVMAATPQKPHPTKAVKDPKNNTAPKAKCLRYAAKPSCWYPCLKWKGKNCVERSKRRICRRKCLEWQKPNVPAPSAPIDPAPPKLIQPPSQLDAAISGIQRYYQEVESLCAQFKQIFTPARFTRSQEATGRFYYRKPAMLRFHYIKPERKDYIFNGDLKTLWMYYPEDSEVKIRNNVSRSDFGVAMQFLWGSGDLKKTFRIQQLQTPKFGQAGDLVIELIPHKQQAIFDKLYFAVMPDNHQVRETIYTDPAGNQNRFIFSQMVRNEQCSLPTSMFRFEPPKGVESIYIQ